MRKGWFSASVACTGAVVGAGFASGREIVSFFTRYGERSWWLIAASVLMMALLNLLCMHAAQQCGGTGPWCALFGSRQQGAQLCSVLLMILTAGAMTSAAGQMVALSWPHPRAYSIGAAGTLLLAWLLGHGRLRALNWLSGVLMTMLMMTVLSAMQLPASQAVETRQIHGLFKAVFSALGYAGMNMTLAIGVVCRCAQAMQKKRWGYTAAFAALILVLLCSSNALYLKHPECIDLPFPIVELLRSFGRGGFWASVVLLYLSIFTTMIAVLYAMRTAAERMLDNVFLQKTVVLGLPLAVSCLGFTGIVEKLYAPAGWICLLVVFLPLAIRFFQSRQRKA